MNKQKLSHDEVEKLRTPWDWKNLEMESPLVTREKITRARELGVIAVVFTADQVKRRIRELAYLEHAQRNGSVDETVYGVVLKGGVQFATPLFSNIASLSPSMNPVVDYVQASRYGNSQTGKNEIEILRRLDHRTDFSGKRFVKIEDTIDEGITMELLGATAKDKMRCFDLGEGITGPASEIGIISLTDKDIAPLNGFDEANVTKGLLIPNAWAGGNGLDGENEAMRWAPEIVLTNVQDEKYREGMPEILDILGERAILGMDDIVWISSNS